MPTAATAAVGVFVPRAVLLAQHRSYRSLSASPRFSQRPHYLVASSSRTPYPVLVVVASAASFDELNAKRKSHRRASKVSILSNLIQEIEPLNVSLIQKDVPADTLDAMKRTISSMLGLLPSDQFNVLVEAFWDPLFKLLVSSMVTGYTLRNAEYRLCLERTLGACGEHSNVLNLDNEEHDGHEKIADGTGAVFEISGMNELLGTRKTKEAPKSERIGVHDIGELSPEAQEHLIYLQSRLSSVEKELHDIKRKNAALQTQHFVGEEKNDLLDYLRSLEPEKVAELSEPSSPGLRETLHSVAHGLLATLSLKMHTKTPLSESATAGSSHDIGTDDCPELVENTSLQFQPLISVSRDYLARLLFWSMLLGHYLRGLECRLDLMQMLTITSNAECLSQDGDCVA